MRILTSKADSHFKYYNLAMRTYGSTKLFMQFGLSGLQALAENHGLLRK